MKNACIRLRITKGFGGVDFSGTSILNYRFQNVDNFIVKKYASTAGNELYYIDEVIGNKLELRAERKQGIAEEENED